MDSSYYSRLSNLIHPLAVVAAFYIGSLFCAEFTWGISACFYFIGREIAQAGYRWIEWFGHGMRSNMPWYGAFDEGVWDAHSFWWNLMIPIMVFICLLWLG